MNLKIWIEAFRLRTLPLALSNAILGSFLALADDAFRWPVFILATLTILFLQVLSNLANDFGDAMHGTDNENRVGPKRLTQSGIVSKASMKKMIILFGALSLISGIWLVFEGLKGANVIWIIGFIILGLAAIFAAVKYTVGKKPYGYMGFGDFFVFIFFGLTGVLGTYYLHTQTFNWLLILPASAIGLLSTAVLNLNNMRDIVNDEDSGKMTLAVILGSKKAKLYHFDLVALAIIFTTVYVISIFEGWSDLLYLATIPLLAIHIRTVWMNKKPGDLNPELKKLALTTALFAILLGLGIVLS